MTASEPWLHWHDRLHRQLLLKPTLLPRGTTLLLALSGGQDSMALLGLLRGGSNATHVVPLVDEDVLTAPTDFAAAARLLERASPRGTRAARAPRRFRRGSCRSPCSGASHKLAHARA